MAGQDRNPRGDNGMKEVRSATKKERKFFVNGLSIGIVWMGSVLVNFLEGALIAYLGFLVLLGWIVYLGYKDLQNKKKIQ